MVTNDYPQLTLDLSTEWRRCTARGAPDLYPGALRPEMDALMAEIHRDVNNGVYRCGFATSQEAYDEAYTALFARLDALSERLAGQRYLMGDTITEADVRLFTTLVRFDAGVPRALQVQPAEADRDAGALGVRAGPVPDPGLRRDRGLRPHQAALLPPTGRSIRPASCRSGRTSPAGRTPHGRG